MTIKEIQEKIDEELVRLEGIQGDISRYRKLTSIPENKLYYFYLVNIQFDNSMSYLKQVKDTLEYLK